MKRLIVGEKELFVNDYPVASVPYLGFGYDYLYYEPEGDNLFKIVKVGSDSIRVSLTEQEIQLCSDFCDAYQPEIIPTPAPEPEKDTTSVFFVGTNGKPGGMKPRCDLQEGEIEITKAVYLTSSFFNSVVPEPIWDQQRGEFVGDTYADKRLFAYYNELQYNTQFAAIWEFVRAMKASGMALPAETQAALDKIDEIKTTYPKD